MPIGDQKASFLNRLPAFPSQAHRVPALLFGLVIFSVTLAGSLLLKKTYSAETLLVIDSENIQNEWDILKDETRTVDFEEQIRSRSVLGPVLEASGLLEPPARKDKKASSPRPTPQSRDQLMARGVKDFHKSLTVERLRQSAVLSIKVTAHDPASSAALANAIAKSFINYRRNISLSRLENTVRAYDEEMRVVQQDLDDKTKQRNDFLAARRWGNYHLEVENANQSVAGLKSALRSLDFYRAGAKENPMDLKNRKKILLEDSEGDLGGESITQLARELTVADSRLNQASGVYKAESPSLLQARLQKELLETRFREKLSDPAIRYKALEQQLRTEEDNLRLLQREESRIEAFDSAVEYCKRRYLELLDQRTKARFHLTALRQNLSTKGENIRILDEAVPSPAVSIGDLLPKALLTALLLSLMGGFSLPLILSLLSPSQGGGLLHFPAKAVSPMSARRLHHAESRQEI